MKSGIEGYKNKLKGLKGKMPKATTEQEEPLLEMEDADIEVELEKEPSEEPMDMAKPAKGGAEVNLAEVSDEDLIKELKKRGLVDDSDKEAEDTSLEA